MSERPIPFSAPMVRALLAGTKTQTRRVVKPQPDVVGRDVGDALPPVVGVFTPEDQRLGRLAKAIHCPYGQPGDRLWVREAWRTEAHFDHLPPRDLDPKMKATPIQYEAGPHADVLDGKLRPGMFMPRWASRITLEVTGVRVERLKDIVPRDCEAEGVVRLPLQEDQPNPWYTADVSAGAKLHSRSTIGAYHKLWDSINGPGSWEANPWVWCVSFRRITP